MTYATANASARNSASSNSRCQPSSRDVVRKVSSAAISRAIWRISPLLRLAAAAKVQSSVVNCFSSMPI
jgi:hypothetical protein